MSESIPPQMMLRSFLTVASGYVICFMAFFAITFGLGYAFFPDFVDFLELDAASQETLMANNPEQAISRTMFLVMLVLTYLACFVVGIYVVLTAPFARFPHAIFLAVILFVTHLQMAIADPPAKKSMTLIYMLLFPIAVLIGAKFAKNRYLRFEEEPYESETETTSGELL